MSELVTRPVSIRPAGTALSRYLMCKASAADTVSALALAQDWRDTPQVRACLEAELTTKAASAPGTTSDATWAAPLATYGIGAEALTLLRDASIVGRLEGQLRRVPFRTRVPRETGTGTGGAWVGETLATPVKATVYDELLQDVYKAGVIVVLTKELLKLGDPVAERAVRETVIAGVAAFLDQQFLDPTVTRIAYVRPASITNGATAITSTGTTAAQMNADLAALLAAVTTPGPLVWTMKPTTAYRIAATIGGTAGADIPRTLFGIPLVVSSTSPPQITLLDPRQILYSDDGALDLSLSEEALLEMDSAPTSPPVAATVMTSLWQLDLWGVKAMRYVAWLRAQTGAVAYMTVAY
jgi:hypothetical protein